ncbi:MAG: hypothetical protein HIU81_11140 [Acidobacteria bacterium]|nr:hypothetical protein [Acidobacteriota bacterium]
MPDSLLATSSPETPPHSLKGVRRLKFPLGGIIVCLVMAVDQLRAFVSLSLAGVMAAPTLLRWDMRRQLNHLPYQRESTVVTLTVQAVLTLAYVLLNRAFVVAVPVVEWALPVGSALIAQRVFRPFGADYLHIDAVAGIVAVLT